MPAKKPWPVRVTARTGRKKTLMLDQDLLDQAREALGARTETDTVMRALEDAVRRRRQIEGIRALARWGRSDRRRTFCRRGFLAADRPPPPPPRAPVRFLADTIFYVTAANEPRFRERFEQFLAREGPLFISAV